MDSFRHLQDMCLVSLRSCDGYLLEMGNQNHPRGALVGLRIRGAGWCRTRLHGRFEDDVPLRVHTVQFAGEDATVDDRYAETGAAELLQVGAGLGVTLREEGVERGGAKIYRWSARQHPRTQPCEKYKYFLARINLIWGVCWITGREHGHRRDEVRARVCVCPHRVWQSIIGTRSPLEFYNATILLLRRQRITSDV